MFSIDTAAAIDELQRSGVENRQAAAIVVGITAKTDANRASKADIEGVRTEL